MWLERLLKDWRAPDLADWRSWLDHPDDLLLIAAGVVMLAMMLGWALRPRQAPRSTRRTEKAAELDISRATNTPLLRRWWWHVHPSHDLMRVDGLELDRTGDRSHCLWVGPTGRGKSQSVATVRCDGARPWLAVMPDLSIPLRARADFIWTAGESSVPIDFLQGTSDDVAHFLTEVFRSGGEGVWKRAAFMATKKVVEQMDARREPRSLLLIGKQLEALTAKDPSLRRMCEVWVTRFLGAAEAMGDSAGPNGVDIAEYLCRGQGVVIDNNAWRRPGLKGDVVAFGLAEAKRLADLVPGGFRLIFEEADQLGERIDLADPFFTAGRLREVAVDALVHSEHKLPDAMQTNSATRVYFRPNKPEHRKKVAEALDLSEGEIDRIPDYHAWVEHDGKIRRLVHFPKPANLPPSYATGPTQTQHEEPTGRWTIEELAPRPFMPYGVLPPPTAQDALERQLEKTETCHLWTGKLDRDGYGIIHLNGNWRRVHRVRYERAYGPIPLDDNGKPLELDHQCRVRRCARLEHLEPVTKAENIRRRWKVRGKGGAQAAD